MLVAPEALVTVGAIGAAVVVVKVALLEAQTVPAELEAQHL